MAKKKGISVQARKAKGRRLAKWVKELFLSECAVLGDGDIQVTSSGAGGEDLKFSPLAREVFPVSIECKNQETWSIPKWYKQCEKNAGNHIPLLCVSKNNLGKVLAVCDLSKLIPLLKRYEEDFILEKPSEGTETFH